MENYSCDKILTFLLTNVLRYVILQNMIMFGIKKLQKQSDGKGVFYENSIKGICMDGMVSIWGSYNYNGVEYV